MSNRRRITRAPQSYTARLQRRSAAGPGRRSDRRGWPRWLAGPWPAVALAVLAEVGHLTAAYVEWPDSAARGQYHVAAGALFGLVAAVIATTAAGSSRLVAATAVVLAGPAWWLAGTLLDLPPYQRLPAPAGVGIAAGEAVLAGLLLFGLTRYAQRRT